MLNHICQDLSFLGRWICKENSLSWIFVWIFGRVGFGVGLKTGGTEPIEGVDKVANTLELSVDRGKADVGDFAQGPQPGQDEIADLDALDFSQGLLLQVHFDVIDDRLLLLMADAGFFAGADDASEDLGAIEGFAIAVAFDYTDRHKFNPLIGREAMTTAQALAPPPNALARFRSP
jgi:hypothetical protein